MSYAEPVVLGLFPGMCYNIRTLVNICPIYICPIYIWRCILAWMGCVLPDSWSQLYNKNSSFVADKWVCISNYIVFESYAPWFLNLPCILLFKYNCVHWHFSMHFLFCCLTSCSLSGNEYYMFPSHYCFNMCSAVDNYVYERTVYTRLATVVKGQLLKYRFTIQIE